MSKARIELSVLVALSLGLLLCHCGKTADEARDAGPATDAAGSATPPLEGGVTDAAGDRNDGASTLDAAPPVNVPCAADASVCDEIPPSVCSDSNTLIYFSEGTCVGGACAWKQTAMTCIQGYCRDGGCSPPTTK